MKAIGVLVAGIVLVACAARTATLRDCTGTPVATVRNNWHSPVDVYAETERGSDWVLGELTPGERREFTLPSGATGLRYRWRGRIAGPPPTSSDIVVSYACS
jgi:hypothetical protein